MMVAYVSHVLPRGNTSARSFVNGDAGHRPGADRARHADTARMLGRERPEIWSHVFDGLNPAVRTVDLPPRGGSAQSDSHVDQVRFLRIRRGIHGPLRMCGRLPIHLPPQCDRPSIGQRTPVCKVHKERRVPQSIYVDLLRSIPSIMRSERRSLDFDPLARPRRRRSRGENDRRPLRHPLSGTPTHEVSHADNDLRQAVCRTTVTRRPMPYRMKIDHSPSSII